MSERVHEPRLAMPVPSFAASDPGTWLPLLERARALDAAGVDRLLVSDHVVFGERLEEYGRPEIGGQAGGRQPTGPDGHWLEPLTTLSVIAGATARIRLGTNILIAALRRPVVLAKAAATLDVLSRGRLDLGVGVGWQREEYAAAGLAFEGRGRSLDRTLAVCQALWREKRARFDDPELRFEAIHMMPKPLQSGGVPIWVSGTVNRNVVRRLARFGAGWIPWGPAAADIEAGIAAMTRALRELGRELRELRVVGNLVAVSDDAGGVDVARTLARLPRLLACGVTDFNLRLPPAREPEPPELLPDLVRAFRAAAGRAD